MTTFQIVYDRDSYKELAPSKEIRAFLKKVCAKLGLRNVTFSVSFVSKEDIWRLNKEYRGIDAPTDILSFAINDDVPEGDSDGENTEFILPKNIPLNLGDMVICQEELSDNAKRFNVTETEELYRLLIHGVLHLTGYDHSTNDPEEPMLIKQEALLKELTGAI